MDPTWLVYIALASTSVTITLVLGVAWLEFGRPRHALTWSFAFGLASIMWGVGLLDLSIPRLRWTDPLLFVIAGYAAALNTLGFRQRAGRAERTDLLLAAATVHAVVQIGLGIAGERLLAALIPLNLLNVAFFWIAADTLHGRRQGERAAERVAESGILLLCTISLSVLIGVGAARLGLIELDLTTMYHVALLILPGVIVAIGLFTIILLAADLADQARRLAATDILTGALNRRGFEEAARPMIESARRAGRALTVVLADLDRFKAINDRFGHPAGDRVLRQVGERLQHAIGPRDLIARFGGEEFALALADTDVAAAARRIEQLRRDIAAMEADLPEPHPVTASFGLAALHQDDEGLAALLARADAALYRSKDEGRNRLTLA